MSQAGLASTTPTQQGFVATITGNTGTIAPVAGNVNIVGTGAISTSGTGNTLTITDSGVVTINGDVGSITGSTLSFHATPTSGSSVQFNGSGSTMSFNVTDLNVNTLIGNGAGNGSISGSRNTGLGFESLLGLTTGSNNTAIGLQSQVALTTGGSNTSCGNSTLNALLGGSFNTAVGNNALALLRGGSTNIGIGLNAGSTYVGNESSNIVIANVGNIGESNALRIGTQGSGSGQQNTCFIAGITGVTTSNTNLVTINTSTGQLGAQAPTTAFNYTNVNHAASPYTVLSTDYFISVDASGGAVTLNFPNAPTANQTWIVKDRGGVASSNHITLTTPGASDTFDGSTSYVMNVNYQAVQLLGNSSHNYEIF